MERMGQDIGVGIGSAAYAYDGDKLSNERRYVRHYYTDPVAAQVYCASQLVLKIFYGKLRGV